MPPTDPWTYVDPDRLVRRHLADVGLWRECLGDAAGYAEIVAAIDEMEAEDAGLVRTVRFG